MRVLIKTLAWGMAVLVLIGVAAPAAIGWALALRFDRAVDELAVPGYLEVVSRDFDRGWFQSQAQVVLKPIGPLCHTRPCPVLTLENRIDQGPLAWGADQDRLRPVLAVVHTQADPTELWPRYVFSPTPGPVTLVSRVGLDTRGRARLTLDGITFDVARQNPIAHLETATVRGELQSSVLGRSLHGLRLDWPSFSMVKQSGGHIGWRGLHVEADAGPAGMLTRRRLSADSFTLDNGQGQATRLSDLRLTTREQSGGRTAVSMHIDRLVLPDNTQGTLIVEANEQGLQPGAWATVAGRWQQLGGWSGGALNEPALYQQVLPSLFADGADVHVQRLELATGDGAIRIRGDMSVPQSIRPVEAATDWLAQLDLDFRLSLPAAFLRRLVAQTAASASPAREVEARLAALKQRQLIAPSDKGKNYSVHLKLHDGQMTINGRRRPQWRSLIAQFQAASPGL